MNGVCDRNEEGKKTKGIFLPAVEGEEGRNGMT